MPVVEKLLEAIAGDDAEVVDALLQAEPGIAEGRDANGVTALLLALYQGKRAAAEAIHRRKPALDVFEAAAVGDLPQLEARLDEDAARANVHAGDGFTPLGLAAFFDRAEAVKLLLKRGADARTASTNAQRVQPLHSAVAAGSAESVKALLAAGADANARQQGGFTPLLAAAAKGQLEIVKLLVLNGADPNGANDAGATPLRLARARRHQPVVDFLESKGAA